MPRSKWVFQVYREWLCFLLKASCPSNFQKPCFYDKIQVLNIKLEWMGTSSLSSTKAWTWPCSLPCPLHLRRSGNKCTKGKKAGSREGETERGKGKGKEGRWMMTLFQALWLLFFFCVSSHFVARIIAYRKIAV